MSNELRKALTELRGQQKVAYDKYAFQNERAHYHGDLAAELHTAYAKLENAITAIEAVLGVETTP